MAVSKFRSKIDAWLMASGWLAIIVPVGALVMHLREQPVPLRFESELLMMLVVMAPYVIPLAWMLLATHYTIDGNSLRIAAGPLRWHVPIDEIVSVERTRSPWSLPALSLDRLRICYSGGKSVMISPADKETFIEALGPDARAAGRTRS